VAIETSLRDQVLEALRAYLEGRRSGVEVSEWAVEQFATRKDSELGSELVKWTLSDLAILGHDDPQWDTPRKDLEFLLDCFLGKKEFVVRDVTETHA